MSADDLPLTRWSLVLAAGQGQAPAARDALADLCRLYWYPLYAYARRRGHDAASAEDLTQAFLARLIEKRDLAAVSPSRGRFRSFLLASFTHFLANEWDRDQAQKRGGGRVVPLLDAEGRYHREPGHDETPERLFDRRWALELLGRVLERLREDHARDGKAVLFDALKGQLTGDGTTHAAIAGELGMTEGAVKVAVHRLRKRYGELLREEIAETVGGPEEVDDEVRTLMAALAGR